MTRLPRLYKCIVVNMVTLDAKLEAAEVLDLQYNYRRSYLTHREQGDIDAALVILVQINNDIVNCHHS